MIHAQKKTPRGAATHSAGQREKSRIQYKHSISHTMCFVKRKDEKREVFRRQNTEVHI